MKEGKSRSRAKVHVQQQQNGHVPSFKLAKLLDPEASWDKVSDLRFHLFDFSIFAFASASAVV